MESNPFSISNLSMPQLTLTSQLLLAALIGLGADCSGFAADAIKPCKILVTEKGTGWPVPLVELKTTHHARFVTDNNGIIAFDLPELMGHETWFDLQGHGYEVPPDFLGFRGVQRIPEPGKTLEIQVDRKIIAKRLGRLTGSGRFAESQKLGLEADWHDLPIAGCDSVQNAIYQGKLFWVWGDTTPARYPLGVFDMTSATTPLQPLKTPEPPLRLKFDYFQDSQNQPRGVAKMPGSGPTWLSGYVSLPDASGRMRLLGSYIKVKPPLEAYECGLCLWNDTKAEFEPLRTLWTKSTTTPDCPIVPDGHAARWKDDSGTDWVLFGNPFPKLRCRATFEAWQDSAQWEVLQPQPQLIAATHSDNADKADNAAPEKRVEPHTGSIAWNEYRQRWVTVFMQKFGKPSAFGELWYAESPSPTGPWGAAVKVLSHNHYTFYNPRLHQEWSAPDSPILLFEGTYTKQFTDHAEATPRYEYNQMLYRLDLNDPALAPAQK